MAAEKTTAIVLRTVEFSETSLIVTLLTRDFGLVSALAKGARRPKGPFEGALDLLAVCRVVLIRKNTDALDLLTESQASEAVSRRRNVRWSDCTLATTWPRCCDC